MANLPETLEEFTIFAMKYCNTDETVYSILDSKNDERNDIEFASKILNWILRSINRFPHLVKYKNLKNGNYSIYIATLCIVIIDIDRMSELSNSTLGNQQVYDALKRHGDLGMKVFDQLRNRCQQLPNE